MRHLKYFGFAPNAFCLGHYDDAVLWICDRDRRRQTASDFNRKTCNFIGDLSKIS